MMAWFKDWTDRAAAGMRGMTRSQRLAIVLSAVLMLASVIWMVDWAAAPEMTPLLDMDLDPEGMALVRSGLDAMGEPHSVVGSRILVPTSANRPAIIAQLQQNQKMPDSTSVGFEALVKESNPWISQEENARRWTVATANELEKVLRRFAGVRDAEVFLDLNGRTLRFSRTQAESNASVTLMMQGGEPVDRSLALAAAKLVSGAVRGLKLRNVSVVDGMNGKSALDWDDESDGQGSRLEKLKRAEEKRIADKIRGQIGDPAARVSVQVELEMTSTSKLSQLPTDGVIVREEIDSSERARGAPSGPPGVAANTGVAAGAGGSATSETRSTQTSEFAVGNVTENSETPSGAVKECAAAINLSYSYLETIFRRRNPGDGDATEADIQAVFEAVSAPIIEQVAMLVKPATSEQVRVNWYYDDVAIGLPEDRQPSTGSSVDSTMRLVKQYGPQSALGLLALVSFALMLNMARKSAPPDAAGVDLGKEGSPAVEEAIASSMTIEDASAGPGILTAKEVDAQHVQLRSMVDQISQMAEKDDEAIAQIVERWIAEPEA